MYMKLNHKLHKASHNLVSLRLIPNRTDVGKCYVGLNEACHMNCTHACDWWQHIIWTPSNNNKMYGQIFLTHMSHIIYIAQLLFWEFKNSFREREFTFEQKNLWLDLASKVGHCHPLTQNYCQIKRHLDLINGLYLIIIFSLTPQDTNEILTYPENFGFWATNVF